MGNTCTQVAYDASAEGLDGAGPSVTADNIKQVPLCGNPVQGAAWGANPQKVTDTGASATSTVPHKSAYSPILHENSAFTVSTTASVPQGLPHESSAALSSGDAVAGAESISEDAAVEKKGGPTGATLEDADSAKEGFQERMYREQFVRDDLPQPLVPGRIPRRPSSVDVTLDEYLEGHGATFDRLLEVERASTWELKREEYGVRIFTAQIDRPQLFFKAVSHIRSEKGLAHMIHLLLTTEERPKWDEMCTYGRTTQYFPPFYKRTVVHMRSPVPGILAPRELVNIGRFRFEADGALLIAMHYEDNPEVETPSDHVRAHFLEGGYVIRPIEGSTQDFVVTFIGCVDPKGWLPLWIGNLAAYKQGLALARVKKYI